MPLLPPAMQGLIQVKAASKLMAGSKLSPIVSAISSATCQYILLSSIVNSVNTVMGPGAGTQIGRITGLSAQAMSSMMLMKAASQGMAGKDLKKMFDAISFGVVNALNMVIMQGTVIGGGPGTGIGRVSGLIPSALTGMIMAQEAFRMIAGSKLRGAASSIAFGICTHIMTFGIVNITCIGAFTPPPVGPVPIPTAPGIGRFY